ncbi:MAG: protein phosphatase CheZ [Nitrospirae bacterium]|nr:protein phosphatase CheZ [Nitrospirota bacterium]
MAELDKKLYGELGELARYIESTMGKLRHMESPMMATATQIPQASEHLSDLTRLTEEGTHAVMELTEEIQGNRARAVTVLNELAEALARVGLDAARVKLDTVKQMLADDDKHLLDIMTALSFQDLVGQRIKKIVAILEDVEHKLLEMIVVFGLKQEGGQAVHDGKATEMLKQLEASRSTALKQDLVNNILDEFGFN